jgi:VirK protein
VIAAEPALSVAQRKASHMLKQIPLIFSLLIALVFPANASSPRQLAALADVENALNNGATVTVAVDLSRCAPGGDTKTRGATSGGLKIGPYRILPDGTLSFSNSHESVGADGQPLWQFIRYQVKVDQTVLFTSDLFTLPSYTRLAPQVAYGCAINQSIKFFTDAAEPLAH